MIRLITEKFKELSDLAEAENEELKARIAALEERAEEDAKKLEEMQMYESDCHRQLIEMNNKYRNFREWVIFTFGKKVKEPPPDNQENSGGTDDAVPPVKRNGRGK